MNHFKLQQLFSFTIAYLLLAINLHATDQFTVTVKLDLKNASLPYQEAYDSLSSAELQKLKALLVKNLTADQYNVIKLVNILKPLTPNIIALSITSDKLQSLKNAFGASNVIKSFKTNATLIPNDVNVDMQWYLAEINAYQAYDQLASNYTTDMPLVIMDTGVRTDYRDFPTNTNFSGIDFVNDDLNSFDDNGHGTVSTQIITSRINNINDTAGLIVAKNLVALKVLNQNGYGSTVHLKQALQYLIDNFKNGAVVNLSLTWLGYDKDIEELMQQASKQNILFVSSAGNDSLDHDQYGNLLLSGYKVDNVISVAGSKYLNNNLASFSDYGKYSIDLAAPAEDIFAYSPEVANGKTYWHPVIVFGTSVAAPMVSAAALMLKSKYPGLKSGAIRLLVMLASKKASGLANKTISGGLLSLGNLMNLPINSKALNELVNFYQKKNSVFPNPSLAYGMHITSIDKSSHKYSVDLGFKDLDLKHSLEFDTSKTTGLLKNFKSNLYHENNKIKQYASIDFNEGEITRKIIRNYKDTGRLETDQYVLFNGKVEVLRRDKSVYWSNSQHKYEKTIRKNTNNEVLEDCLRTFNIEGETISQAGIC